MKRTYPSNVDGQIFYIDEDAFLLLQNYLHQLKITFTGAEGEEIVGDIESRIREHFNEKTTNGTGVIVLSDVEKVIETMGRPEDLSANSDQEEKAESPQAHDQEQKGGDETPGNKPFISFNLPSDKKLYRNVKNKVFGGVFSGLAAYLGWNANIMRILFIVLIFALASFIKVYPFIIIYLIAWMIIPPALTPRQLLQMNGTPINVDTVGQTIMAEAGTLPPPYKEDVNYLSNILSIIGKCIIGIVGLIVGIATIGSLLGFLSISGCTLAYLITDNPAGLNNMGLDFSSGIICAILTWLLLAVTILGSITYGCISAIFSLKPISKTLLITLIISSIMLAAIAIILTIMIM